MENKNIKQTIGYTPQNDSQSHTAGLGKSFGAKSQSYLSSCDVCNCAAFASFWVIEISVLYTLFFPIQLTEKSSLMQVWFTKPQSLRKQYLTRCMKAAGFGCSVCAEKRGALDQSTHPITLTWFTYEEPSYSIEQKGQIFILSV